jgi:hypothetical protein
VGIEGVSVVVGGGAGIGDDWIIRIDNNKPMMIKVKAVIPLTEFFFLRLF